MFVSDFFDFSIYVDASEKNLRSGTWNDLKITDGTDPKSYFHQYASLPR